MTTKNNKKKNNSARKIIPAAGMLMVSALMLSTSTYAWFTMSREVEVQNIKMTATVPEDIQISLGHLQYVVAQETDADVTTASAHKGLADNEGILTPASDGGTADNGGVKAPNTGVDAVSMLDWSSSADISAYYRLGKIIPASSTDGVNIYFTPDASGVGKTLRTGAGYYQAAAGLTEYKFKAATTGDSATPATFASDGEGDSAKTTLHAITDVTEGNDKWNDGTTTTADGNGYTTAFGWNTTEDDGYYVDIPVWLRTSSTSGATLAVDAYVTTDTAVDDDDLYLAARAVVLPDAGSTFASDKTTSGLIEVREDGWSGNSVVNFMTTTNNDGEAVKTLGNDAAALGGKVATYGTDNHYDGAQLITLQGKTEGTNGYGTMRKVWIRVWLEGEDPNCWNQNAGQDFNISLKFTKEAVTPATAVAPNANAFDGTVTATELVAGETHTVQFKEGETVKNTLVYTYNGAAWELTSGTYHAPGAGKKYTVASTDWTAAEAASRAKLDTIVGAITTSTAAGTNTVVTIGDAS